MKRYHHVQQWVNNCFLLKVSGYNTEGEPFIMQGRFLDRDGNDVIVPYPEGWNWIWDITVLDYSVFNDIMRRYNLNINDETDILSLFYNAWKFTMQKKAWEMDVADKIDVVPRSTDYVALDCNETLRTYRKNLR